MDDDIIVDRPNDDRGVRVVCLMIYERDVLYILFVYYELRFNSRATVKIIINHQS